jgi:hypothetical protein
MSTKAIREALDWLENYLGHEPEAQEARRAARDELLALEKACQTLADWGVVNELLKSKEPEVDAAADYLYAIGHAYTERNGEERE